MRLLTLLLIFGLTACGPQNKYIPVKGAVELNDSAMQLAMHTTQDSGYKKNITTP